jgi:hypothetical protein
MSPRCRCGAVGADTGDLISHAVTALSDPDDIRPHGWDGEPDQVAAARAARQRREEVRRRLADAAGVTVEELRAVLR